MWKEIPASLSRVGHDEMRAEDLNLVLVGLHLDDRAPGSLVRRNKNVTLAS